MVVATRRVAEHQRPGDDGRLRVGPEPGIAHLVVSKGQLGRALRVLQTVLLEATARGWPTEPPERQHPHMGVGVRVGEFFYPVEVVELTSRVPMSEREIERWRYRNRWRSF